MSYCNSDDETVRETSSSRFVVARKARRNIQPGDLIQVTSGFTYEPGGKRTGYFREEKRLVAADGSFVSPQAEYLVWNHPRLSATQVAAIDASIAEKVRLREAAKAEQAAIQADKQALLTAFYGGKVKYQGRTYVVRYSDYTLKVTDFDTYFEDKFKLEDVETGEIREQRVIRGV